MVLFFVPFAIAAAALLWIQRQTRLRGADLPLGAAIGTGVILGLVTIEVATVLIAVIANMVASSLT